jgi:hypothetical protein
MVTRPHTPTGGGCETDAAAMIARQLPHQHHPLTRAYMLGARSTSQSAYSEALRLIRACETDADQLTIDQCKLAAEVLIERRMP